MKHHIIAAAAFCFLCVPFLVGAQVDTGLSDLPGSEFTSQDSFKAPQVTSGKDNVAAEPALDPVNSFGNPNAATLNGNDATKVNKAAPVNVHTVDGFDANARIGAGKASLGGGMTFAELVDAIIVYFNYAIYIITALTVIYTVIGAFNMIGNEKKREEGKTAVYYGVIGLFVMMSIWGLVNILDGTFNLSNGSPITPRQIQKGF